MMDLEQTTQNIERAKRIVKRGAALGSPQFDLSGLGLTTAQLQGVLNEVKEPIRTAWNLNLSGNNLTGLPKAMENFPNLRVLDLSANAFRELPRAILPLTRLRSLSMSNNWLETLSPDIANFRNLENLYLVGNELVDVPQELLQMRGLMDLVLTGNPLSRDSMEALLESFPRGGQTQLRIDVSTNSMLRALYPDDREKLIRLDSRIPKLAEKRGFRDGKIPQNILDGTDVVNSFLEKLALDYGTKEITKLYHDGARHLLEQALSDDKEASKNALYNMARALGNCDTPIKDILEKTGLQLILERNGEIDATLQTMLDRQAFEKYVLFKKIELPQGERIEAVQGLVNAIFMPNAETQRKNIIRIKGTRDRLPSKTTNDEFAFEQVSEEMKEAFVKLCCKTDDKGIPTEDGHGFYELDPNKYRMITEYYMKFHGKVSEREKAIAESTPIIEGLVPRNFITEHYDNPEVAALIDFPAQEWRLRELLSTVPDNQVQKTANAFLKEYQNKVVQTARELSRAQGNLMELGVSPSSVVTSLTARRNSDQKPSISQRQNLSGQKPKRRSI